MISSGTLEKGILKRAMNLANKTILITGASSGLGHAIALELGRRGNKIIATARREGHLRALAQEIQSNGGQCMVVPADSIDTAAVEQVLQAGIQAFGPIDMALLNAGGGSATSLLSTNAAEVLRQMRINYDTMANYLCPLIQHMKVRGGTIAYTSSPAGSFPVPLSGPYGAAKAAGTHLFEAARLDTRGTPIQFVALYPGFTYTDALDPDDVPLKGLIISKERAVLEMIWAIEKGKASHMFPKRIKWLIALGRAIPASIRRTLLRLIA